MNTRLSSNECETILSVCIWNSVEEAAYRSNQSLLLILALLCFLTHSFQGFADDTNYTVRTFADLTDGVILG